MSNASDFIIENCVLKAYKGRSKNVSIPEGITMIGNGAFSYCQLCSVEIPEGVTHIGRDAFSGTNLSAVTLPQSLQEIGVNAFGLCYMLTEMIIPDSVRKIGSKAFNHCGKLEKIVVGNGVHTIGSDAFADTGWIKKQTENMIYAGNVLICAVSTDEELKIPEGTVGIGGNALRNCANLKRICIPSSVQVIETKAFAQCTSLEIVKVEGNPEIAKDAIPESAVLTAKNIPFDSIKPKQLKHQAILGYFFVEDTKKTVPESISKYMAKNFDATVPAIERIPELLERILSRDVLQIEQVELLLEKQQGNAQHCTALLEYKNRRFSKEEEAKHTATKENKQLKGSTAVELKKLWKPLALSDGSLEVCGYYGADTYVVVPTMIGKKQVTRIGSCCFYVSPFDESNRKNITFIDIPEGVSGIGDRAFVGCKALLEIHIPKTVSAIGEYAFWECSSISIHAPAGSYAEKYAKENNIPFVTE